VFTGSDVPVPLTLFAASYVTIFTIEFWRKAWFIGVSHQCQYRMLTDFSPKYFSAKLFKILCSANLDDFFGIYSITGQKTHFQDPFVNFIFRKTKKDKNKCPISKIGPTLFPCFLWGFK
jgi:hypothetical protein